MTCGVTLLCEQVFDYRAGMVRRHWWWNARWGRLARRDVFIHEQDGRWAVEDRWGGVEGRSRWAEMPDEAAALECAAGLRREQDGWQPMPV